MSQAIDDQLLLVTLARNWWMVGVRGGLAILFGVVLLLSPSIPLNVLVALFAGYAALDGASAVASALWASRRSTAAWPILFEGAASLGVAALAFGWPLLASRELITAIAVWGLITGVLEILAAVRLPRAGAGYWLVGTGGVSSLFLALIILAIPHATQPYVVKALGTYSLVFGGLFFAAALVLRHALLARGHA